MSLAIDSLSSFCSMYTSLILVLFLVIALALHLQSLFIGFVTLFIGPYLNYNFSSILNAFNKKTKKNKPTAIIFNTIKGKGIKEFENDPVWHARKLSAKELAIAKKRLEF